MNSIKPIFAQLTTNPLRAFVEQALVNKSVEQRAPSRLGFDADFSRALSGRGWLGLNLPKKYGGQNRSPFARFVMVEELLAVGVDSDPDDKDGQTLLFWHPAVTAATGDYIRSAVKIESGAKSALDPHL